MVYFNSDGNESTMCGNGGRCIVKFAQSLGIIADSTTFMAIDGEHEAKIEGNQVNLKIIDVNSIEKIGNDFWLDTGSPHYVKFVHDLESFDVFAKGRNIRNSERFIQEGTNVNFIESTSDDSISIRTYERGVEGETLACGTGVTAAAIVYGSQNNLNHVKVKAVGGDLEVQFEQVNNQFKDVWLKGPTEFVFQGKNDFE